MQSGEEKSTGNVPAFLMKVWALVEDSATDELIYWDPSGTSFHVFDQQRFSREILPLFFKHSNIASFIRQLNMYGFRKVAHIDQGSLKIENDDLHFQHPYFQRGERDLLQHIKRKVSNQTLRSDSLTTVKNDEVSRVLTDVTHMKSKQDAMDHNLEYIKKENKLLWREVATLRQKHHKQQEIVNKLIQFLVSLVSSNRAGLTIPALRRGPLAIDSNQELTSTSMPSTMPDVSQQLINNNAAANYTIESPKSVDLLPMPASLLTTGPIIHELPEVLETPDQQTNFLESDIVRNIPRQIAEDSMRKKDFITSDPPLLISPKPAMNIQPVPTPESPSSSTPLKIPTAPSLQDAINYAWTTSNLSQDSPSSVKQDTLANRRKRTRPQLTNSSEPSIKKFPGSQSSLLVDGLTTPVIESEDQADSTLEQLVMSSPDIVRHKPAGAKEDVTLALPHLNPGEDISVNNSNQLDFLNSDLDGLRGLLQDQYKIDPTILIDLFDSTNPWAIISEKNAEGDLLCDTDDEPGTSYLDSSNGDITGTELVQYNPKELFPELLDDNVMGEIDDLD